MSRQKESAGRIWFVLTLLMLLFAVFGCQFLPEANFSPAGPHLKILTYNVNWGGNRQAVAAFLQTADADIICLQETHPLWENDLMTHLKKQYPYSAFHHSGGAGGIAFLSKYPLSNGRIIESKEGWFPAFYVKSTTQIGELGILNIHLKPPLSDTGSADVYAYLNAGQVHLQELQRFFEVIAPDRPMIVTGDFNEDESGKACRWLTEQGYMDCLSQFDRKSPTWFWRTSAGLVLKNRYDHIFIDRQLNCTGADVYKVKASDHEPVLAVIQQK